MYIGQNIHKILHPPSTETIFGFVNSKWDTLQYANQETRNTLQSLHFSML